MICTNTDHHVNTLSTIKKEKKKKKKYIYIYIYISLLNISIYK